MIRGPNVLLRPVHDIVIYAILREEWEATHVDRS